MRIACIGGGPGGLFFSLLAKQYMPDAEVELFERNQATDAFGFGVVFSDATLEKISSADSVLEDALQRSGKHWENIEVWAKGEKHTFHGNGMSAIHRRTLLPELQEQARRAGVAMHFGTFIESLDELDDFDVVVAADGANSNTRRQLGESSLGHSATQASAKFIWFGTSYLFDGLTFIHKQNEHGNFAAHAYPISDDMSTFIVEADEATWRAAGLDEFDVTQPPGVSDMKSKEYIEALFSEEIDGHEVIVNNSRWANFNTRTTQIWHRNNVALLGDAIHTAHFSVGSGTKMAMEDAVVLAESIAKYPQNLQSALQEYENIRRPEVAKVQSAAIPSLSWWEHFGTYHNALSPLQFTFHFVSRSIGVQRIQRRDPKLVEAIFQQWQQQYGSAPLETPLQIDTTVIPGRFGTYDDGNITVGGRQFDLEALGISVIEAPSAEYMVPDTVEQLPSAGAIAIRGGTPLTRRLLAEQARFKNNLDTLLIEQASDDDAVTAVLSGRADLVASEVNS